MVMAHRPTSGKYRLSAGAVLANCFFQSYGRMAAKEEVNDWVIQSILSGLV